VNQHDTTGAAGTGGVDTDAVLAAFLAADPATKAALNIDLGYRQVVASARRLLHALDAVLVRNGMTAAERADIARDVLAAAGPDPAELVALADDARGVAADPELTGRTLTCAAVLRVYLGDGTVDVELHPDPPRPARAEPDAG
jgi:hypothetical protein